MSAPGYVWDEQRARLIPTDPNAGRYHGDVWNYIDKLGDEQPTPTDLAQPWSWQIRDYVGEYSIPEYGVAATWDEAMRTVQQRLAELTGTDRAFA